MAGETVQPGQARRAGPACVPMNEDDGYPLAQFRATYFEECAELLESLQANLERLSAGDGDGETLHAVFRSVHSIKGGAGAFGFTTLINFAHVFESLLDALRESKIAATFNVTGLLMRASDKLSDIVSAARSDTALDDTFGQDILLAMQECLGQEPSTVSGDANTETAPTRDPDHKRCFAIRFA